VIKHKRVSVNRTDQRVINNGDLVVKKRNPPQTSTKAAVPSIITERLDNMSETSEETFPALARVEMSQFQEASNLSSIELRNQYIVKERR
jgi:hypothetical protein